MKASKFGKYIAGQLKNLSPHEQLAMEWWKNKKEDEVFPSKEWIEQSEVHRDAAFLIADIKAAFENGREVKF